MKAWLTVFLQNMFSPWMHLRDKVDKSHTLLLYSLTSAMRDIVQITRGLLSSKWWVSKQEGVK